MSDTPRTDGFPTSYVERSITEALNPKGMTTGDGNVRLASSHVMAIIKRSRQIEKELADLTVAAEKFRDAFTYDPGHSDLDNEQPIHITVTLGDWRKLNYLLGKGKSDASL